MENLVGGEGSQWSFGALRTDPTGSGTDVGPGAMPHFSNPAHRVCKIPFGSLPVCIIFIFYFLTGELYFATC